MFRGTNNRRPRRPRGERGKAGASVFHMNRDTGQPRLAGRLWLLPDAPIRHCRRQETADAHQFPGGPGQLAYGAAASTRVVLRAPRGVFFAVVCRSPRHDGCNRSGSAAAGLGASSVRAVGLVCCIGVPPSGNGWLCVFSNQRTPAARPRRGVGRTCGQRAAPASAGTVTAMEWSELAHKPARAQPAQADGRGYNGTRATRTPCVARMAGHDVCNRAGRRRGCDRGSGEVRRGIRRSVVAQEGSPTTMSGLNLVQVARGLKCGPAEWSKSVWRTHSCGTSRTGTR